LGRGEGEYDFPWYYPKGSNISCYKLLLTIVLDTLPYYKFIFMKYSSGNICKLSKIINMHIKVYKYEIGQIKIKYRYKFVFFYLNLDNV
jgi:hypothetical protein